MSSAYSVILKYKEELEYQKKSEKKLTPMKNLSEKIEQKVREWREEGYFCESFPLISNILRYQVHEEDTAGTRYLRSAQLLALETYWYLRLVEDTPSILDLYKLFYEGEDLLNILHIPYEKGELKWAKSCDIIDRFKEDQHLKGSDALYESLTLPYPSYIFALAMGAGKTVLIGTIIATEFTMGLAYPDGHFTRNALVFAPGTTIIESLRELSRVPYHEILPSAQYKVFMANLKMCYVSERKNIGIIPASKYNVIVTNTEKIIVRKRTRKDKLLTERSELEENLRFKDIKLLPDLGVFSDEAHHTYGNKLGDELKRVRETINRLKEKIVCVVNTTGTPYYKRKVLKDVVIWYGISEGMKDNVLKSLHNGVIEYSISREKETEIAVHIIHDFYKTYKNITLPSGEKAKIAFYFKRQEDLDRTKYSIAQALAEMGESAASILVNTQKSSQDELDEFNRLNDPSSQKRVILLIAKGREGWNCPSLFASALITQQTTASNFVLQAAARCLRQVPANTHPARVYLDTANKEILNKELRENFGGHTSLALLSSMEQEKETVRIRVLKTELPKLEIEHIVHRWCKKPGTEKLLLFSAPEKETIGTVRHHTIQVDEIGNTLVETEVDTIDNNLSDSVYAVATQIATALHLSPMKVLKALQKAYPTGLVPKAHLDKLREQAEESLGTYEKHEERLMRVLALIHTHNDQGEPLFELQNGQFFHTLQFSKNNYERIKEKGLLIGKKGTNSEQVYLPRDDKHDLSFHYSPYHFDSGDERDFFLDILSKLDVDPIDMEGFFFTGGLTDPQKTDFWFEYKGKDDRYHKYFPDFVLMKKDGSCFIVEIKSERDKDHLEVIAKEKSVRQIADIQPDKVKYHVIYSGNKDLIHKWIYPQK